VTQLTHKQVIDEQLKLVENLEEFLKAELLAGMYIF
jgi:hypothetical protein